MAGTRRWGVGTAAVARHLYAATRPITQVELAALAGVSQPAVSKVLSRLADESAAIDAAPGWLPVRAQLAVQYATHCTARVHIESVWYRIDAPGQQADDVLLRRPAALLSGDIAAERVAPWNLPTSSIVYDEISPSEMDSMGFVPADSRPQATLILRPLPDRRLADEAADRIVPRLHLVADLVDLDRVGSSDRREQIERLHDLRRSGE